MYAYEVLGRINAGLVLGGQWAGELEWIGTESKWNDVEKQEEMILYNRPF